MISPPRFAETVLTSLGATPEYRDAVVGDLAEELAWRATLDGPAEARRWYYREALRSIPHLLGNGARSMRWGSVRRVTGIALSAWAISTITLGVSFVIVLSTISRFWPDVGVIFRSGSLTLTAPTLLAIAASISGSVFGGYVAAWLDRETPLVSAATLGLTLALLDVAVAAAYRQVGYPPLWTIVVTTLPRLAYAMAGGLLQLRARSRSPDTVSSA
jgi:hypothetical protein